MTWCVIMHNMIVGDEDEGVAGNLDFENMANPIELLPSNPTTFDELVQMHQEIPQRATLEQLKENRIEHFMGFYERQLNIIFT